MDNKIIVSEIQDSWETIIEKINNGTANYSVGQYKPLDLGCQGVVRMQIVDIYGDGLRPAYDFVAMEILRENHQMTEPTRPHCDWEYSSMRIYLHEVIFPLIPKKVRSAIQPIMKSTLDHSGRERIEFNLLWIPSYEEIFGGVYGDIYHDAESRKKVVTGTSNASCWWLRSASSVLGNGFSYVSPYGNAKGVNGIYLFGVVLGFSL